MQNERDIKFIAKEAAKYNYAITSYLKELIRNTFIKNWNYTNQSIKTLFTIILNNIRIYPLATKT